MTTPESTVAPEPSPYRGRVVAVGTQHGKQHQFAPPFHRVLGAELVTPAVDTDQFGTFTGEVARTGAPADAARAKARLAMSVTGRPYGLASEASYGPLPGGGWATRKFCCSATTLRESRLSRAIGPWLGA